MRPPFPKRACHSNNTRVPPPERNRRASRNLGLSFTRSLSGVTLQVQGGAVPCRHAPAASSSSFNLRRSSRASPRSTPRTGSPRQGQRSDAGTSAPAASRTRRRRAEVAAARGGVEQLLRCGTTVPDCQSSPLPYHDQLTVDFQELLPDGSFGERPRTIRPSRRRGRSTRRRAPAALPAGLPPRTTAAGPAAPGLRCSCPCRSGRTAGQRRARQFQRLETLEVLQSDSPQHQTNSCTRSRMAVALPYPLRRAG